MATLKQVRARFEKLRGQESALVVEAINENHEVAEQMIAEQLAHGIKSDGTVSDFTYSPFTIASKKGKPGLSGEYRFLTNFDTGESYQNIFVKADASGVEFGTKTTKEADISDHMDGMAFRPTQENKEEWIAQHVEVSFVKKVRELVEL